MAAASRVLHLLHALEAGGVEALIMNVYRCLDRRRMQFDVAVSAVNPAYFDAEFTGLGGRIFHLPDAHRLLPYSAALARLLATAGPFAAVHSHLHHFSAFPLAVAAACGVPVRIAHSHNTRCGKPDSWHRACYRGATRAVLHGTATRRVGCSRAACEALFGSGAQSVVLRNAIEPARFRPMRADREAARARLGIAGTDLAMAHVGRFEDQKNHAFLVHVAAAVMRRHQGARLLLVGDGRLRLGVERACERLGIRRCVDFLGVRRDVPEILAASDVFVFPSAWEGLGIAVVEAQAAGVPAVVSEAVPLEADLRCGLFRRLALSRSAEEWAPAVEDAACAPRPKWEVRESALSAAGYDIRTEVHKWEELYALPSN
jgi:glycosyltransferase involved in cell wall biosynthesis